MLWLKHETCVEQAVDQWIIDLHITNRHIHDISLCSRVLLILMSTFKRILLDDEVVETTSKGPHIHSSSDL